MKIPSIRLLKKNWKISDELNMDYDTFIADSVEDAKKQVEGMLLDHWKEQIVYLEDCIDLLQNGKE